jgi:transposase
VKRGWSFVFLSQQTATELAHIQGEDRHQIRMRSLEEAIEKDNPVRVVEAFVEHLDLSQSGFAVSETKIEGRPAFEPKVFLKLYLYGYLNGLRSSRRLEKESIRNIELQWLLCGLQPNYHSIADFRKINPKALKNTFKLFVLFLKDADLVAGEVVAIDGTKVRAHNSKKNNYNPKKIERHLAYIEEKTSEYLKELEANDASESIEKVCHVAQKIERLKTNKIKYEALQSQMETSGDIQVSTTDVDARALLVQGQVVEVTYNVQAAVDSKHKLVVATHTINRNDRNAMSAIALEAKENLTAKGFTALLDKGYHNGRELQTCQQAGINTIVAIPEIVNSNEHGTTADYVVTRFTYNQEEDTYTCPQGSTLKTTGTWHRKTRERDSHQFKKYRTPDCKTCPVKDLCTGRADGGREIDRSEYAAAVELNRKNYSENKDLYRKRQEINEHIFGTIKRKWGYNHTNLKGLEKVNGEMALIMTVYNLKRAINILGIEKLIEKLQTWKPDYKKAARLFKTDQIQAHTSRFTERIFWSCKLAAYNSPSSKALKHERKAQNQPKNEAKVSFFTT